MNPLHSAGWEKYSGIFLICPPHISKMLICILNISTVCEDRSYIVFLIAWLLIKDNIQISSFV